VLLAPALHPLLAPLLLVLALLHPALLERLRLPGALLRLAEALERHGRRCAAVERGGFCGGVGGRRLVLVRRGQLVGASVDGDRGVHAWLEAKKFEEERADIGCRWRHVHGK